MLKLKLQYFGHLMKRTDSSEKTLMLGKIEGRMRRGRQKAQFRVDTAHAARVSELALNLCAQIEDDWQLSALEGVEMLPVLPSCMRWDC